QIRGLEMRHASRLRTGQSAAAPARAPRVLRILADAQTKLPKELADLSFLLFPAQGGDGRRKILHGKILFAALCHGDADGIEMRVQDVRAVTRRKHPVD